MKVSCSNPSSSSGIACSSGTWRRLAREVVGQGDQPIGDRPEPIEAQHVHGQASERGHDLNAVDLAVAVCVFLELRVAGPVPGVLNRPAVGRVLQQLLGAGAQTGDVVAGFIHGLAVASSLSIASAAIS